MIQASVPLLTALQQGMAELVPTTTQAELASQASQTLVAHKIEEESKMLAAVEEDEEAHGVSRDAPKNSQNFTGQEHKKRQKQSEVYVETAPSYHNPLAGFLVSEKV